MRFLLIILLVLIVCYMLMNEPPAKLSDVNIGDFLQMMSAEISELIAHLQLMPNPAVKLTILVGAALLFVGALRAVLR